MVHECIFFGNIGRSSFELHSSFLVYLEKPKETMKSHFSPLIKAEQKLLKLAAIISAQGKYAEHNKELRKHKRADKTEYFHGLKGEQKLLWPIQTSQLN